MIQFELDLMNSISNFLPDFVKLLALIFTQLGGVLILIGICGCIYWLYDKKLGEKIGYISLTSVALNNTLKGMVNEKRPFQHEGYDHLEAFPGKDSASGTSFPSGHSQNSATVYTLTALNFKQKWIKILSIIFIILVPITRIIIGVHFPHDVIVGSLLGLGCALLLNFLYDKFYHKRNILFLITILVYLPFVLIFPSKDLFVGYGLLLGFILGISLENKYINFTNDVSIPKKILRLIIGIVVLLVLKEGPKYLIGLITDKPPLIFHFIRYFFLTFTATFLVPLCFKSEKNQRGI